MPLSGLLSLEGEKLSFDEGIEYFEEKRIMPAEAVIAMVDNCLQHEGFHARTSPSIANPDNTCRREVVIRRFLPYWLDPLSIWEAQEGTLWHKIFELAGAGLKGWEQEVELPKVPESVTSCEQDPHDGKPCFEVFPGIFMRGTLDKHKDSVILTDFKTEKYPMTYGKKLPSKDYGEEKAQKEWPIQLTLYAMMLEMQTGTFPKEMYVWRMYRGSRERTLTFRKFEVEPLEKELLWRIVGEHLTSLARMLHEALEAAQQGQEVCEEYIKGNCPMDGLDKKMFRGTKCSRYCSVQEICFALAGKTTF